MTHRPALRHALKLVLACSLFVGSGLAQAQTPAQTPTTLRFATFLPPNGIFTSSDGVMGRWAKAVEEDSGGLVKVEILPGGTLGAAGRNPAAQLKMVTDGIADLSFVIPTTTPGRFPDDNLFGLPVTESSLEGSLSFWRLHKAGLMRGYDDKSFYIIGLVVNPPNTLHSKTPINTLDDMKGKRMQASGQEQQDVLRGLGATPVGTVSVRDVAEAISRGVVDGTPKDWIALHSFRIADAAKHHVDIPLGAATIMIAMNRAKYDALPPAAKAAIDKNSGEVFSRMAGEAFDRTLKRDYEKTKADPAHTIVTLPKEERARWDKSIEASIAAWRAENAENERLWQEYLKVRAEVRRELGTGKS
jgi:TRAP-type C4-dicarboxylate transport system substrate-binding protein